jgi:proton-translocating NADH-quinone oxidoreductase chain L
MPSFDAVTYVWTIPALPLLGAVILLAVTRPLAVRRKRLSAPAHGGTLTSSALADTGGAHGGAHDAAASQQVGLAPGHAEHAAEGTPFWDAAGGWIATILLFAALANSLVLLAQFPRGGTTIHLYPWFALGKLSYSIDFHVDALTVVMLVVVTSVSALVHLYSIGYMEGDPGFSRFFIELSLFTVSMLILVLAANFLVLYIGWELVGLSSYLLIGFWYERPDPPPAALKAFVTTRFGDFFFLIGILVIFFTTKTFSFDSLNSIHASPLGGIDQAVITVAMILVFCGAVGKSAQFPLHVWLPDAMEGPTPVSALIHAATMVAAGVYLVARLFPIYAHFAGPQSLLVVGYVGGFTALFAASIALVQNDIKRVLAYSTVSQLGYMFVGLAVAATNSVGMFHLWTHAFFKALLFLGSGSVIHALHRATQQQDMRYMGGMARRMPWTAATFLVATLSIAGIPPFSGFFSKDDIIGHAFAAAQAGIWGGPALYVLTLAAAVLTAFYMFRLFILTFGGPGGRFFGLWGGRAEFRGDIALDQIHESPWTMVAPLALLAVPSFAIGFLTFGGFGAFLNGTASLSPLEPFTNPLTYVGVAAAVVGILVAWVMYGVRPSLARWYQAVPLIGPGVYNLLAHKYYIDEIYLALIRGLVLGGAKLAAGFDAVVIDGIVNGSARAVRGLGSIARESETGRVSNYAAAIFAGALVLVVALFIGVAVLTVK